MILLRDENKANEAIELAKTLGAEDTLPLPVKVQLGRAYAAAGKIPEMLKVVDQLKDLQDASALTFAGEGLRRVGEHQRARQALDGVMRNELDHDVARALRALVILEDDDDTNISVAIDDLRSLKELGKDSVGTTQRGYASLGTAIIGRKIGRPDRENEAELKSARAALPSDPEVPLFEAKQAIKSENWGAAIAAAEEAVKRDRFRLEPYLTLAEANIRAKNFAGADKALADAGAAGFGSTLALGLKRGQRLGAENRGPEAVTHLNSMLSGGNDTAEVYREIGRVYMRTGDNANAVDWMKKAAEKAKNRAPAIQANVYTWLGKAYAQAGQHPDAKKVYAEALAATSEYTVTYWWLGLTLEELGERGAAVDAYRRYVNNDPNGTFADRARAKISGG